jgi:hypothetical protein
MINKNDREAFQSFIDQASETSDFSDSDLEA